MISAMQEQVLRYIRERNLVVPGDRVMVAVSGGADSVALLRLLLELRAELGIVLAAAHFNHGLRGGNSDADEQFVVDLAKRLDLDLFVGRGSVSEHAVAKRIGLEAAGRELRYQWLTRLAIKNRFERVATAHTVDDQAETVLLKFLRGAGTKGLAGIYPEMIRDQEQGARFVRPLLSSARSELEAYLTSIGQPWREDESNLDPRFRRNRVRHELLPLLERDYNPNLRQALSEAAEISRGEEEYWAGVAGAVLQQLGADRHRLPLAGFAELGPAFQRRVLKYFLEGARIEPDFEHIEWLRRCALAEVQGAELSDAWSAQREGNCLVLKQSQPSEQASGGYEYRLPVPGKAAIPELGCVLRIVPVPAAFAAVANPGMLLKAGLTGPELLVRNWQPGDRYQPAYRGSEEKLKRLFAERKIPADERPLWPVVLKGAEIVWVRGLPIAEAYCWRAGDGDALQIECVAAEQR